MGAVVSLNSVIYVDSVLSHNSAMYVGPVGFLS